MCSQLSRHHCRLKQSSSLAKNDNLTIKRISPCSLYQLGNDEYKFTYTYKSLSLLFSDILAVVKSDGYKHGAIPVARHLKSIRVPRLAVQTVSEGKQLRQHGITGPIHILGANHSIV